MIRDSALTADQMPIILIRSISLVNAWEIIERAPGINAAAAIPCIALPVINISGDVDNAQIAEPKVKMTMPINHTFFRP